MINENNIKDAFLKIKNDILFLKQEIIVLRQEIQEIREIMQSSTLQTQFRHKTHFPAHNLENYALNNQNLTVSIGNEGVPADRQHIYDRQISALNRTSETAFNSPEYLHQKTYFSQLLDSLRKDLGEKFKKLTQKEFYIFSVLYTLEEEKEQVTYSDIAQRTGLTESSIRDYIVRLIHKGIPIIKEKLNNKIITLKIPRELKDLATLDKLSKLKGLS